MKKLIILLFFFCSCNSIRQAQSERANRHIHNYRDLHNKWKWHTVIGCLLCMMFLFSCKVYKQEQSSKKVETWNTKHLKKIHKDGMWAGKTYIHFDTTAKK